MTLADEFPQVLGSTQKHTTNLKGANESLTDEYGGPNGGGSYDRNGATNPSSSAHREQVLADPSSLGDPSSVLFKPNSKLGQLWNKAAKLEIMHPHNKAAIVFLWAIICCEMCSGGVFGLIQRDMTRELEDQSHCELGPAFFAGAYLIVNLFNSLFMNVTGAVIDKTRSPAMVTIFSAVFACFACFFMAFCVHGLFSMVFAVLLLRLSIRGCLSLGAQTLFNAHFERRLAERGKILGVVLGFSTIAQMGFESKIQRMVAQHRVATGAAAALQQVVSAPHQHHHHEMFDWRTVYVYFLYINLLVTLPLSAWFARDQIQTGDHAGHLGNIKSIQNGNHHMRDSHHIQDSRNPWNDEKPAILVNGMPIIVDSSGTHSYASTSNSGGMQDTALLNSILEAQQEDLETRKSPRSKKKRKKMKQRDSSPVREESVPIVAESEGREYNMGDFSSANDYCQPGAETILRNRSKISTNTTSTESSVENDHDSSNQDESSTNRHNSATPLTKHHDSASAIQIVREDYQATGAFADSRSRCYLGVDAAELSPGTHHTLPLPHLPQLDASVGKQVSGKPMQECLRNPILYALLGCEFIYCFIGESVVFHTELMFGGDSLTTMDFFTEFGLFYYLTYSIALITAQIIGGCMNVRSDDFKQQENLKKHDSQRTPDDEIGLSLDNPASNQASKESSIEDKHFSSTGHTNFANRNDVFGRAMGRTLSKSSSDRSDRSDEQDNRKSKRFRKCRDCCACRDGSFRACCIACCGGRNCCFKRKEPDLEVGPLIRGEDGILRERAKKKKWHVSVRTLCILSLLSNGACWFLYTCMLLVYGNFEFGNEFTHDVKEKRRMERTRLMWAAPSFDEIPSAELVSEIPKDIAESFMESGDMISDIGEPSAQFEPNFDTSFLQLDDSTTDPQKVQQKVEVQESHQSQQMGHPHHHHLPHMQNHHQMHHERHEVEAYDRDDIGFHVKRPRARLHFPTLHNAETHPSHHIDDKMVGSTKVDSDTGTDSAGEGSYEDTNEKLRTSKMPGNPTSLSSDESASHGAASQTSKKGADFDSTDSSSSSSDDEHAIPRARSIVSHVAAPLNIARKSKRKSKSCDTVKDTKDEKDLKERNAPTAQLFFVRTFLIFFGLFDGLACGLIALINDMGYIENFGMLCNGKIQALASAVAVVGASLGPFIFVYLVNYTFGGQANGSLFYTSTLFIMILFFFLLWILFGISKENWADPSSSKSILKRPELTYGSTSQIVARTDRTNHGTPTPRRHVTYGTTTRIVESPRGVVTSISPVA